MHLLAEIPDQSISAVLAALSPFVAPENIKLFNPVPTPDEAQTDELEELAKKVVEIVRPQPKQPARREALQRILNHYDTFWDQGGEPNPALRNGIGAISKALRQVFKHDHAVRRLAVPKKTFFDDGAYKGTMYMLTPLGERVRELLTAEGSI